MSMLFNGLSGVVASQVALDTVSQNLANALTPNYTRQGVALTAKSASNGSLSAGHGVQATSLVRYADSYKTQQMWRANSTLGQFEAGQTYMLQLEQVMGDAGGGLSARWTISSPRSAPRVWSPPPAPCASRSLKRPMRWASPLAICRKS